MPSWMAPLRAEDVVYRKESTELANALTDIRECTGKKSNTPLGFSGAQILAVDEGVNKCNIICAKPQESACN